VGECRVRVSDEVIGRPACLRGVLSYGVEACFAEMIRLDEIVLDL
jgi:hypothetical protein